MEMDLLGRLLGIIVTCGFFAVGIATGIFGITPYREPSVLGLLLSLPVVVTHPVFLVVWGVLSLVACVWTLIDWVRVR